MGHATPLTRPALLAVFLLAAARPVSFEGSPRAQDSRNTEKRPGAETRAPPSPRKPIAGIQGFESVSTLTYAAAPARPHQLRATYVFPERVRWEISTRDGKETERLLQYRYGDAVYRMSPGTATSAGCEGEDRVETLLQMELRRALMLYPEGFEWKEVGSERRAEISGLGFLIARGVSTSDSMPAEIAMADSSGKPIDAYKVVRWRETGGRRWPASMELWHAGELAWKETVESVDSHGRYVDSFFVPPDRRDRSGAEPVGGSVRTLDLPATCSLRVEVRKGASWDDAVSEMARRRAEWSTRLSTSGLELDPNGTIEISMTGEPIAVLLRLSKMPEKVPEPFTRSEARTGLALQAESREAVDAPCLDELRKALPKGSVAGTPYVRFDARTPDKGRMLVVLPYSRPR